MAAGRPTLYNEAIAQLICERVATHTTSLQKLCKMYDDMPNHDTVYAWRARYDEFSAMYFDALKIRANILAEEIVDLADDIETYSDADGVERVDSGMTRKTDLQIKSRQWMVARLEPRRWGDRKELEQAQATNAVLQSELDTLRAKLDAQNKKDY